MPRVRKLRPILCLLLAVSTAVGTVAAPARGCVCGTHQQPAPAVEAAPGPVQAEAVCHRGCCSPESANAKCCCRSEIEPPIQPTDAGPPGCQCAKCDCDGPNSPPDSQAPTTQLDTNPVVQVDAAALVPPAFLPLPCEQIERSAFTSSYQPDNLVITLSRLTC